MSSVAFKATSLNIIGNTVLFILKLWAGLLSGSIALISDSLNSLNDIAASIATFICVRISHKKADEGHPFGHSRAEPIAGMIIAILAGILGFEVFRESIGRFFVPKQAVIGIFALSVPVITIVAKLVMAFHFKRVGREIKSPALIATAKDSLMDVLLGGATLVGIVGVRVGYDFLDPMAGLVISLWIVYAGYSIGVENIDYLMGKSPKPGLMENIKEAARNIDGVKAINTVRAHYVGSFVHVEIHIEVDKNLSTLDSHTIGKAVERSLELLDPIDKAFIHIDPI
jgi:cation diffusion facilitator family transporter